MDIKELFPNAGMYICKIAEKDPVCLELDIFDQIFQAIEKRNTDKPQGKQ